VVHRVERAGLLDVLVGDAGLADEGGSDRRDDELVQGLDDGVVDAGLGDGAVVELPDDRGSGFLVGAQTAVGQRRIRGLDPRQRLDERRRLLLDAALELFGTRGYAATSVEQLCQAAYVSTRSFYELFGNKEACYLALHRQLEAAITERLAPADDSSADVVARMVAAFVHAMVDDIRVLRVTSIEGMCISPAVDQRRREARHQGAALVQATWARIGATPQASPRRLALGVIGAFFEIIIDWYLDPQPCDVATLIQDMTAFVNSLHAGLGASWPGQRPLST
jgi:AcrR family transcriptional regulator